MMRKATTRRARDALLDEPVDQLASLTSLSAALARAANRDEACAAALACLAETLTPDRASVLLVDAAGAMRFRAWRGLSEEYRRRTEAHSPWSHRTRDPEPVLVADLATGPSPAGLRPVIENEGIRAFGFFPLLDRGRLLGTFAIYFDEPHVFDAQEVQLAQAIGSQLAIEVARGHREAETGLLQHVTEALARTMTVPEVVAVLVREASTALSASATWIAEIDEERRELHRLGSAGYHEHLEATYGRLPLDRDNPTARVARASTPLWYGSAREVREAHPSVADDYESTGFEAMAAVPLIVAGRTTGVIALSFDEERSFAEHEKRLLVAIADQSGQALERAGLHAEVQDRADAVSVLAHVGDGVFQLDADERVTLWNRGAEVITGISEAEAVDRRIGELIRDWRRIRPRISITDVPLAFGRRDAIPAQVGERELWLVISGVASGHGVVYAFRDVTESERLEKARRDFLATASHELRTPLSGVFGAAKTLLYRDMDDATRRALLEVIDTQTARLAQILDELLFASRLDAGLTDIALNDCDVAPLAEDVVRLQRPRLATAHTLNVEMDDDLPPVRCDPERLRQVLVNLLDNAIKYSPSGGAITVSLEAGREVVRISVADEGLGIPPAERERIFEKFYRLDPGLRRGVGGTGLGLYISRQYINAMGGRLWVEPSSRPGSMFHLELPLAKAA
jgi:signal transduction histidine kinase